MMHVAMAGLTLMVVVLYGLIGLWIWLALWAVLALACKADGSPRGVSGPKAMDMGRLSR